MKYIPDSVYKDKRQRRWELFVDICYFDMACVRCLDSDKSFHSEMSWHFTTMQKAEDFMSLVLEAN